MQELEAAIRGRYAVERELGSGGMATVYLARDLRHHRQVAIKVLRPEVATALGPDRFLREIQVLAALAHPHILPLHDSGSAGPLLYYVMPYVAGESLRELITREGRVLPTVAVRLAHDVATALDFAHRRGVIHRDIKPENILLLEGTPVLADFGIALASEDKGGVRITESGLALGTPAYMSPEQALAETEVDGRTDVYAVGVVMFEMLTGEPPYTGDTVMAITAQKLVDPLPDIRTVVGDLPDGLRDVMERAMAQDPAERYASAAAFAEALEAVAVSGRPSVIAARAAARKASVAVLPFVNMSGDADAEFFSDGISEELTHALAAVDGLDVVARASAFAFKGSGTGVREIGRLLRVTHVLEGSVRRAGDTVRITVDLITVADGFRLWSERFDRRLDDVFAVQDEIARAIVQRLVVGLMGTAGVVPVRTTAGPEAYEQYLKGRYHWNRRTGSELEKSIACFHRAIEMAPAFARGHAGLADAYLILGIYGLRAPDAVMREAAHSARQALMLEPTSAEAVTALACARAMYDWDWAAADAEFRRAIALNPKYSTARQWYAMNCLAPRGRFEEAQNQLAQARALDPLSLAVHVSIGLVQHFALEHAAAEATLRETIAIDDHFGVAHFFLGQVLESAGRLDEAGQALERAGALMEHSAEVEAALARTRALAGQADEARARLADLERRALGGEFVSPALLAQVHLGLGDTEEGLAWLERSVGIRAADVAWLAVRPSFASVRGEPRFRALLEKTGLG